MKVVHQFSIVLLDSKNNWLESAIAEDHDGYGVVLVFGACDCVAHSVVYVI